MKQKLKIFLKKFILINCLAYIAHNLRIHLRGFSGDIESTSGTTHATINVCESVHYITDVFQDYKRLSGLDHFYGKMAEIGPGDNVGVALMFLNDGCTKADLADRFYSKRNAEKQSDIYTHLSDAHPAIKNTLNQSNLSDDTTFPMIKRYYGKKAAGETFFSDHQGYDIIVSRSVLEHLNDPILSLNAMYNALNPGGQLIHKVDLRDHAMFTPNRHDSTFLAIPSWIYSLMTKGSGFPNRVLIHEYKQAMKEIGCPHDFFVTGLYGAESLDSEYKFEEIPIGLKEKAMQHFNRYKKSYASQFKNIDQDDLIVSGFFLVAKKPN
ncbi:MAG: methyltransferase domain-containing protein [Pseudomonadota bacterium]